jgi:nicotinamidase-related amidase
VQALLLVDVLKDFEHEDGDLSSPASASGTRGSSSSCPLGRDEGTPVVYANDGAGLDASELLRRAGEGKGSELVLEVAPRSGEPVVLKSRYSALDRTNPASLLEGLGTTELTIAGTATEMCVFLSAIDALRLDLGVTVAADACATVDKGNEALALDYLERVLDVPVVGR